MTTPLFELPVELRSLIFSSFSLRDISRLRQCCSAWKNNLQDLSFMKVLDFSYSPDIPAAAFNYLLNNRINKTQNNITKVILAHTRYLNKSSLEELFQALPRIKDIRIRYSLTSECIPVLLRQENLEAISYRNDAQSLSRNADPLELKCTKLLRFKMNESMREIVRYPEFKLKLLEMNPALINDVHCLKFLAKPHLDLLRANIADYKKVWDLVFSSKDLRVHKGFWNSLLGFGFYELMDVDTKAMNEIFEKSANLLFLSYNDQTKDNNIIIALGHVLFDLMDSNPIEFGINLDEKVKNLTKNLEHTFTSTIDARVLQKHFEKFKRRPFHRHAREYFLASKIEDIQKLTDQQRDQKQYEEELNKLIDIVSPIMKRMPRRIRLMRAPLYLQQGKLQEAFDEYFGIIDPRYKLNVQAGLYTDKNAHAIFGAYHVARDYLKSPELLQRLEAFNPDNYKNIDKHLLKLHNSFDRGVCTREVTGNNFYKQYWYACYTCNLTGDFKGLCYSCTTSCHKGHEIAYLRPSECYCDCSNCEHHS